MRHLLAKDVRLLAPYFWLIVPVHALYSIQSFLSPEFYFWMNLAAALAWTIAVTAIDWRIDADHLAASLPVTRADIVTARYVSAASGLAAGAILFVLYGHLTMAVASSRVTARWQGSPSWASADGVAAFLLVGLLVIAVFLPFFFRWGLPLGLSLFSATAVVALAAVAALARAAWRSPDDAREAQSWSETLRGWLLALSASWGPWVASLIVIAGAAALGALSLRLSTRFYQRREL
jgi:hypothetical protein